MEQFAQVSSQQVSHEMKTPLNTVIQISDRMMNNEKDLQKKKQLTNIKIQAQLILLGVNNLLDYSALCNNRFKASMELFNVLRAVEEVISMLQLKAKSKNADIVIDVAPRLCVKADRGRIQQIMANLILNAISVTQDDIIVV